jgi:hypothetical protein
MIIMYLAIFFILAAGDAERGLRGHFDEDSQWEAIGIMSAFFGMVLMTVIIATLPRWDSDPHSEVIGKRRFGWGVLLVLAIGAVTLYKFFGDASNTMTTRPALNYVGVATLPCMNLLNAEGRGLSAEGVKRFSSLIDPIAEYIREKDKDGGLGSNANITDYVLTECRLNENFKIGEAIDDLFDQKQRGRLPAIPIGGATADPEAHADWDAFEKWIHHQGPRPKLQGPPIPTQTAASSSWQVCTQQQAAEIAQSRRTLKGANDPCLVYWRSIEVRQHPEKAFELECNGMKAYPDPQPPGHPTPLAECDRRTREDQSRMGIPVRGLTEEQKATYRTTWGTEHPSVRQ